MSEQREGSAILNSQRVEMEKWMGDLTSAVLTELRLEGTLCDVVIKVGDVEFDAHKIILCGCSSYFRTLFTGAWATSEKKIYNIPGVSSEMMQLIINYAYTHTVPVTEANVVEILAAADQFLVPGIVKACCVFLEDQLCLRNCIGIWRLVEFYHCPELRQKVFLYILQHFEEILYVPRELMELSVQHLAAIIENDHLNVRRENAVFEVVLRWINHMPDQRRGHISLLLSKVRLGMMNPGYLQNNVIDNAMIRGNAECTHNVIDALMTYTDFKDRGQPKYLSNHPMKRPRLPPAILLVTGGKDGSTAASSLEAYDSRADCWVTVNSGDISRAHHGVAVINNFVYLIGGCSHEVHLNTVQRFDLVTSTWKEVACMNFSRCFVSIAVEDGCIYAMGGFNGQTYFNTVECYRPETDQWTMVASMPVKRCSSGATSLNGKVYICGGFNGSRSLSASECYNPRTNQWTRIAPMITNRCALEVVAYRNYIYAVGGTVNGITLLRSVEAYNPQTNGWSHMPSMHIPRGYFGIAVLDDQIFVIGGFDGFTTMQAVEHYDQDAGMWFCASGITMARSGLSCCVLHGLHSVVENLFPRGSLMPSNVDKAAGGSI